MSLTHLACCLLHTDPEPRARRCFCRVHNPSRVRAGVSAGIRRYCSDVLPRHGTCRTNSNQTYFSLTFLFSDYTGPSALTFVCIPTNTSFGTVLAANKSNVFSSDCSILNDIWRDCGALCTFRSSHFNHANLLFRWSFQTVFQQARRWWHASSVASRQMAAHRHGPTPYRVVRPRPFCRTLLRSFSVASIAVVGLPSLDLAPMFFAPVNLSLFIHL